MKSKLNKSCVQFLTKDKEKFQDSSFNSTKFLLEILPGKNSSQVLKSTIYKCLILIAF